MKNYKKLVSAVGLSAVVVATAGYTPAGVDAEEVSKATHTSNVPRYADSANGDGKVRLTDGMLVASPESGVFLVDESQRYPIESPQVFRSYGYHFSDVRMIQDSDLEQIPSKEVLPYQSGTLVSAEGSDKVYLIEDGKKRYIPSPQILMDAGYTFDHVMKVSQASVDRHPTGEDFTNPDYIPNGAPVYAEGTGVFKIEDDKRRPVPDQETYLSNFGTFDMLRKVSKDNLEKLPKGENLKPADGTLVQYKGGVYLIEDGQKRPFASVDQFLKGSYKFSDIRDISEGVIASLPNGPGMDKDSLSREETITHIVQTTDATSTLEKAVKQADLASVLGNKNAEYTVFAPTNSAFGNLDDQELNDLLQDSRKEDLQGLLKDHVVEGEVTASSLVEKDSVTTLNGKELNVEVDGSTVKVGGVEVDMTDIQASNGVVHTVKNVINAKDFSESVVERAVNNDNLSTLEKAVKQADLVSTLGNEDKEYTVFAPTNSAFGNLDDQELNDLLQDSRKEDLQGLLKDHVVKGEVTASSLVEKDSVTTLNGKELNVEVDGSTVKVGGVEVDMTDIQASNGVVHTVKNVINAKDFSESVVERAVNNDNLSTLEKAVKQADLVSTLGNEDKEYTVLAPTDSAFDKLDDSTLNDLLKDENKSELQTLLKDHVISGELTASDITSKDTVTNLNGNTLDVTVDGSTVKIGDIEVDMTDIQASNGVVHTIKEVIVL